jgi:iron complex outermembrane receptor protein
MSKRTWKMALSAAPAALAAAASTAAFAQEASDGPQLGEIIVTAQKREERLQAVPATITAATGEALEVAGLTTSRDLTQLAPGLVFSQQSIVIQPTIRGVGGRGVAPGDEGTVPIYVDGIYQPVQHANAFQLANIKRIEVLKGPQGTLFGRNAMGGAINILTLDPGSDFALKASAAYGTFNMMQGELYVSAPLGERAGVNLSVFHGEDDGYIDDVLRGGKANPSSTTAIRGKLKFDIGSDGDIKLIGFYTESDDPTPVSTRPLNGNTAGNVAIPPVFIVTEPYQTANDVAPVQYYNTRGVSGQWRQGLGFAELTAMASWQKTRSYSQTDSDATPRVLSRNEVGVDDRTITGELRLASSGNTRFKWLAGAFYFNGKACYCDITTFNGAVANPPTNATQRSEAFALFVDTSYKLSDPLTVSAGVRYSNEVRSIYTLRGGAFVGSASRRFTDFSPRFSITYELSPRARIYASYSKGFKSGVYNTSSTTLPLVPVNPEKLHAYEVGLKTEPNSQLRFNFSGFYYDYRDLQVSARNATTNLTVLQNAAKAESYGLEAQLDAAVTRQLNLSASVAYTHARFTDFPGAQVLNPTTAVVGGRTVQTGNASSFINASGKALPKAPDWTVNLRADYTVPVGEGSLRFAGNLYHSSRFYAEFANRIYTDAYTTIGASVKWSAPGDQFSVTGFVDNLTDERHALTVSNSATSDFTVDSRPRTFGVRLQYTY